MDHRASASPSRRLPAAIRVGLILFGLLLVFGVVLVIELTGGSSRPGSELLAAPRPLLPATLEGYRIQQDSALADGLSRAYAASQPEISGAEAAFIPLGGDRASVAAARVAASANPDSSQFRAGVLSGAAGGFGIDATQHAFRYSIRSKVAIYVADAPEGRLYVWFFRDAFVQLFVPSAGVAEADEIQRQILNRQIAPASAGPSSARIG